MTTLTLIPMPLGDPDDITLRALRMLRAARVIAADDLRAAQTLLDQYAVTAPLIPYAEVADALTVGDVALMASFDARGDGAVADIVRAAIARGIRVEPLPGANAAITALVLSGLPTDAFVYVGALPDDLSRYAHEHDTLIFTSDDLKTALDRLLMAFGDRPLGIATALTRPDEVVYRGSISAARQAGLTPPGECVLILEGAPPEIAVVWDETRVRDELRQRLAAGEPLKLAAKSIAAESGWDRRAVYKLGIDLKNIM